MLFVLDAITNNRLYVLYTPSNLSHLTRGTSTKCVVVARTVLSCRIATCLFLVFCYFKLGSVSPRHGSPRHVIQYQREREDQLKPLPDSEKAKILQALHERITKGLDMNMKLVVTVHHNNEYVVEQTWKEEMMKEMQPYCYNICNDLDDNNDIDDIAFLSKSGGLVVLRFKTMEGDTAAAEKPVVVESMFTL